MKPDRSYQGLSLDTLAVHAGQPPDPTSGAVMTPIVLASTFAQERPGQHKGFEYSRSGNPTRKALEDCLATIEGGKHGLAFSSGSSATAVLLHTLRPGDHVLAGDDLYGGTFRLLDKVMRPMGIGSSFLDLHDLDRVRAAITPATRMICLETPTNPMLKVFDVAALATIARERGVTLVVDNTFATPVLQRPLELGAHVVLHSTTKYLNGHSDVVGGALITSDGALAERLAFLQNALGAVPSPFDCYLVLRGLKTLGVRVRAQCATATTIATRLEQHPAVERVYYPGLASHPDRALIDRQMKGPGAMISLVLRGGLPAATAFLEGLQIFSCAESLGGVESLAEHPAIMTHASVPEASRSALGISDGLVRLSVGLEAEADLWGDIEQALARATR
ncbi:trans-sulfuration enzyme family protein [Chondromyces crocatus]|uniref:Cystathionine gamma-synthase n=1 Tax=Chondromyces crocatus TaxID=52 RepID=A0A0K1EC46_CHOCO|nr:aminotransferase class I/II-fold pyridoxal phosphate-dependent enzyme [Chondromyces crocatus]AKT38445.1 cystathionine gamma-synthase [Chondromyces crocatus]